MSTVAEIFNAIQELSLQERCELEALLHPFEDDEWDKQMKRDAAAGKFGTVGLAAAIFIPWMNISGSVLANYWSKRPAKST